MTVDVGIDHLAKVVLVRFLHCNSYSSFPSPFPFCHLRKEVTVCSPHLRSGELCSPSLKVVYLHKLLGIFLCGRFDSYFPFINVFSHLFITLCVYEYLFYLGGCNSIPLYFVIQNIPTLPIGSSFSWVLRPLFFTCFKLVLIFWPYKRLQVHLAHMLFIGGKHLVISSCPFKEICPQPLSELESRCSLKTHADWSLVEAEL